MKYSDIDYTNKKDKWTVMKYVASFDLLLQYVELIKSLNFQVDDKNIDAINKEMQQTGVYNPHNNTPSRDTQYFKIIQICNNMFAHRGKESDIVLTPLCNLLLEHKDDMEKRGKIVATMLVNLPYNHPYNRMDGTFNLFPYRLLFKLLMDKKLVGRLYLDEVFYLVAWTKEIDDEAYKDLVSSILQLRSIPYSDKLGIFTQRLPVQDSLANMLHETTYLFRQLKEAGIVDYEEGEKVGILCHGGFGRNPIPETLDMGELKKHSPTGRRSYRKSYISLKPYMLQYLQELLDICSFTEKPHTILKELGSEDFILKLWNFYPQILLKEIGIDETIRSKFAYMQDLTNNIKTYSLNTQHGDCYRFEEVLCDAFNEFKDVEAKTIAKSGTADIECIYLTLKEKFDVEAKSTNHKLNIINAGRLDSHRKKIGSGYTIVIAPSYVPSVISDIANTNNVILTVTSLCNFLYQSSMRSYDMSYKPIRDIIMENKGNDISRKLDNFVFTNFGIRQNP